MCNKSKKLVSVMMVCFLAAGLFAGCAGKNEAARPVQSAAPAATKAAEVKKLSIITVPAGAQFPDGKSIMKNEFFDMVKSETGYDIDWQLFKSGPQNPLEDQLNLMLASGNAPDLIQVNPSPVIANYAKSGGLAELDAAFEKSANYLKKTYTKEVMEMGKINGKLYALPRYTGGAPIGSMAVRTDWLEELGLKLPGTLDEYYNVLKQFKDKKKDSIPLVLDGSLYRMIHFMGAFGIYSDGAVPFLIENGKATFPMVSDKGAEFIKYMSMLYKEGLIDKEFLVDKEAIQKMIAGKGGMMMLNYVEITRNMAAFKEKNPGGNLAYMEPPAGKNGEQGYLSQPLTSTTWIVPKSSASKADSCVAFLDQCNASDTIVNTICFGMEGTHYQKEGTNIKTLPAFKDIVYKGYYSRVILDNRWDDNANKLEGFDKHYPLLEKYKKQNDILFKPMDVPANSGAIPELQKAVQDDALSMIVKGYSDDAFNAMKEKFKKLKGEELLKEYQTWFDSRKK